jgi:GxxExxY protein
LKYLTNLQKKSSFNFCIYNITQRFTEKARSFTEKILFMETNQITEKIIGCAINVHKHLGPGLLESAYEECLTFELKNAGLRFERQKPVPVIYKEIKLDCGYRIDVLVENTVVIELKTVDAFNPVHEAQILTYMKFAEKEIGLLINFNVILLKNGVKRYKK